MNELDEPTARPVQPRFNNTLCTVHLPRLVGQIVVEAEQWLWGLAAVHFEMRTTVRVHMITFVGIEVDDDGVARGGRWATFGVVERDLRWVCKQAAFSLCGHGGERVTITNSGLRANTSSCLQMTRELYGSRNRAEMVT